MKVNDTIINLIKKEIGHLQSIIKRSKPETDCTHEEGELYALNWVIDMIENEQTHDYHKYHQL